jgi:hypothetical protein
MPLYLSYQIFKRSLEFQGIAACSLIQVRCQILDYIFYLNFNVLCNRIKCTLPVSRYRDG